MLKPTPIPATPPELFMARLEQLCARRAAVDVIMRRLARHAPTLFRRAVAADRAKVAS
jgi:hypothetical protein